MSTEPLTTTVVGSYPQPDWVIDREALAGRLRKALDYVPPERLAVAPDCGMKYLPRNVAFGNLSNMVEGTRTVRRELSVESDPSV